MYKCEYQDQLQDYVYEFCQGWLPRCFDYEWNKKYYFQLIKNVSSHTEHFLLRLNYIVFYEHVWITPIHFQVDYQALVQNKQLRREHKEQWRFSLLVLYAKMMMFSIVDEMELIHCEPTVYIYTCHNFRIVIMSCRDNIKFCHMIWKEQNT